MAIPTKDTFNSLPGRTQWIWNDSSGKIQMWDRSVFGTGNLGTPSDLDSGRKTVAVPGTAEPLVAATRACLSVTIVALDTNTGYIYVGDSTVDNTKGRLRRNGSVTIEIDDLNKVYIDADIAAEGVSWFIAEE